MTQEEILLKKFAVHQDFTRLFLDAFVLIDKKQNILKFNSAFCQIVGLSAVQIMRIKSLKKILHTQISGGRKTKDNDAIEQLLKTYEPTRIDEVPATTDKKQLSLIISSYPYLQESHVDEGKPKKLLGLCLLLRDVTAETNLQSKYKNKSLESITDPLTELHTRRYFEGFIDKELAKFKADKTSPDLAVVMIDLDGFKSINDRYGHQVGDFILAETAQVLKAQLRRSDILARYGGEEMIAFIFSSNPRGARVIAEKLRSAVENHTYLFRGIKISVTISVGVSFLDSYADTRREAVKRADRCLYQAKREGKNTVVFDFDGTKKQDGIRKQLQKRKKPDRT